MITTDFTTTLIVDNSPTEVYNAITDVKGWWSEDIEGNTAKLDDEFLYRYRDVHRSRIRLIEAVRDKKIVWLVKENHFSFTKDKAEWTGTTISFEIFVQDNQTHMRFTHWGLVPAYECYEVCWEAWTNYINNSLKNLITTGKGQPNPREGDGFNSEIVEKWNLG